MKTFLHFLYIETLMFFRARIALFWTFAFPLFMLVVQMALFGRGPAAVTLKVGLADLDHSKASARFVNQITHGFGTQSLLKATLVSLDEEPKDPAIYDLSIVLPAGFGAEEDTARAGIAQVVRQATPNSSIGYGILQGITNDYNLVVSGAPRSAILEAKSLPTKSKPLSYSLYLVTGLSFMVILSTSMMGFATPLVGSRESGVLRIYQLYPTPAVSALAAFWLARLAIVASSIALLFGVAAVFYHVPLSTAPLDLTLGFLGLFLGTATFLSFGLLIATFSRDTQTTTIVCNLIYTLLLFSGNLLLPTNGLPNRVREIAEFLPLNALAGTVRRCFSGQVEIGREFATYGLMIAAIIVSVAIAQRHFRWIPSRSH